jgi:hypothetical protein
MKINRIYRFDQLKVIYITVKLAILDINCSRYSRTNDKCSFDSLLFLTFNFILQRERSKSNN